MSEGRSAETGTSANGAGDSPQFWRGRTVLVTGHTGFKGAWLSYWLARLGANVIGYALPAETPSLFEAARIGDLVAHNEGRLEDLERLRAVMRAARPDVVMHLAAQAFVRRSYRNPVATYASNLMGTVNVLEALRDCDTVQAAVMITTDKVYENEGWPWPYREVDRLGGEDPYSASKACCEIAIASYRRAFLAERGVLTASTRAGNVLGGGDWGEDRLVPDLLRSFAAGEPTLIRYPRAVRPWQDVLDCLGGYLLLARRLVDHGADHAKCWNFGPETEGIVSVGKLADRLAALWGEGAGWRHDGTPQPKEQMVLRLDAARARSELGWRPRFDLDATLAAVVEFHRAWLERREVRDAMDSHIRAYGARAA